MLLPLLLAIPFIGAALIMALPRFSPHAPRWIAMAATAMALGVLTALSMAWSPGAPPPEFTIEWMPAIGLELSIWLDGPALFYAWLVLGIGLLVFFYSGYYMDPGDAPWRFYGMMTLFMGAMLGVVTSKNIVLMFVFWELTSISSFLLIGHWHHKEGAREGAQRALIVTGGGGLCLLAGIVGIDLLLRSEGITAGLSWPVLWEHRHVVTHHPAAPAILLLMLIGAFTKSAQFPFHFWLPGAMEAPTPVSAYLHAATMVKAGIYLLGRLYPAFGEMTLWLALVASTGVVTMCVGGFMAVMSKDLKQLLAYSTVSQLGLLTAYYGFGYGRLIPGVGEDPHLLKADLLLVASHAFFKGALFMLVGIIDHGCHTREWPRLGGLIRSMPFTAVLTILACLSMAGVPLTLGYTAKELFIEAGLYVHAYEVAVFESLVWVAVLASTFTVAYSMRMAISPFFGAPRDSHIHPHEASWGMLAAPAVLVALCVAGGVYLPLIETPVSWLVNQEFIADTATFKLTTKKVLISGFLFLVGGPLVFFLSGQIERLYVDLGSPRPFAKLYEIVFLRAVPALATITARVSQSTSLRRNIAMVLIVVVGLVTLPMVVFGLRLDVASMMGEVPPVPAVALFAMIVVALGVVLTKRDPILRIAALSIVGILVGLFFVLYRAPDIAMTQMLVELASLFLLLMLLPHLGDAAAGQAKSMLGRASATVVAIAAGSLFAVLTLLATNSPLRHDPIIPGMQVPADYYLTHAKYPMEAGARSGGGANVVNVILVDFRGFDTMGEIMVLAVAAMGVFSLMKLGRRRTAWHDEFLPTGGDRSGSHALPSAEVLTEPAHRVRMDTRRYALMGPVALPVAMLALAFATVLFFAGHNAPGGGFIAGLLAAVAFLPGYLARGVAAGDAFRVKDPTDLIVWGMVMAVGTALVAVFFGAPFFTSAFQYFTLPIFGSVGIASAMFFDLGVMLIVTGSTLLTIRSFGRA